MLCVRGRLFGVKCSGCGLGFDSVNLVMRARERVYHVDCFRCVACRRRLDSGDEFAARRGDGGLVCRQHFDRDPAAEDPAPPSSSCTEPRHAVELPAAADSVVGRSPVADATATTSAAAGAMINAPLKNNVVVAAAAAAAGVRSASVARKKPAHTGSFFSRA